MFNRFLSYISLSPLLLLPLLSGNYQQANGDRFNENEINEVKGTDNAVSY